MSAGYSLTPLPKKLGIKAGHAVGTFGAPGHFSGLLAELPEGVRVEADPEGEKPLNVAILFVEDEDGLRQRFGTVARRITRDGGLWVAWPKQSSPLATDLKGADVRGIGLAQGLVDNKVCAIDEDWSGLRFVYRLEDR